MKKQIIYTLLILLLFLSPLLMFSGGTDYTTIAVIIFVALCYAFKVQSFVKIIIPVFGFSFILPALIQLAIIKSIPLSWSGSITKLIDYQTVGTVLSYFIPIAIASILYFILNKIPVAPKSSQETML